MNNKLILGTVQFGLNYGINNTMGKPSEKVAFEVLDAAFEKGIECLDTADAYGDAIQVIGKYHQKNKNKFKILSKFKGAKSGELKDRAIKSLTTLGIDFFEVYSYHSFNDFLENPQAELELLDLKKLNLIRKIGVSVYTNIEFDKAIESENIDVIQIPYNILDNHNIRGALIERAKKKGKEIHTRSVFLQGLFFMKDVPQKLLPLEKYLLQIKKFCNTESLSIQELALNYALFNPDISNVLIGVDNKEQLLNNLTAIERNNKAFDFINEKININEVELLNPVNWK